MTDEERREAERLALGYKSPSHEFFCTPSATAFVAGYAAACEAKRAACSEWKWHCDESERELNAERARSAKLITLLKDIRKSVNIDHRPFSFEVNFPEAEKAIAEYEAG